MSNVIGKSALTALIVPAAGLTFATILFTVFNPSSFDEVVPGLEDGGLKGGEGERNASTPPPPPSSAAKPAESISAPTANAAPVPEEGASDSDVVRTEEGGKGSVTTTTTDASAAAPTIPGPPPIPGPAPAATANAAAQEEVLSTELGKESCRPLNFKASLMRGLVKGATTNISPSTPKAHLLAKKIKTKVSAAKTPLPAANMPPSEPAAPPATPDPHTPLPPSSPKEAAEIEIATDLSNVTYKQETWHEVKLKSKRGGGGETRPRRRSPRRTKRKR